MEHVLSHVIHAALASASAHDRIAPTPAGAPPARRSHDGGFPREWPARGVRAAPPASPRLRAGPTTERHDRRRRTWLGPCRTAATGQLRQLAARGGRALHD
jgi:hypothetical protein